MQKHKLNMDLAPRPTTGVTITFTSTDPPHAGQKQAQQPPQMKPKLVNIIQLGIYTH